MGAVTKEHPMREVLYILVDPDTRTRIGPTSNDPGLLYDWSEGNGYRPGTVAAMRYPGKQKRETIKREAARHAREVAEHKRLRFADDV